MSLFMLHLLLLLHLQCVLCMNIGDGGDDGEGEMAKTVLSSEFYVLSENESVKTTQRR